MNTTTLLAATIAALFLATNAPTFAATGDAAAYTEAKRCHRTVHKRPYRIHTPCKMKTDGSAPTRADTDRRQPVPPPPEAKP